MLINTIQHKHRILPGHMGGTYDIANVVLLTIEQHAKAHKLLWEQHGCWQDKVAWLALSGAIGKDEIIFTVLSEAGRRGGVTNRGRSPSQKTRHKLAVASANRAWSEESKQRLSNSLKGHRVSEATRTKISHALLGRPTGRKLSDENKRAMSLGKIGKPHPFSPEALQRRIGQKRSPEARERMRLAQQKAALAKRNKLANDEAV